ncbi:RsmB/NOP family class I SAM-dependent RNA methyltransferase [Paenibacillus koleovorans]|uniref:RsmB/NOP family class I SAM-dependent RNA methyltransferase n=1 Tax=Paenibacillus koleovorans TaxID=121608 RepID=UPI000FD76237|nr:RsmB/NOP family class I SAM-dependent RNA methyltransferase [Paenibacillus koleovorans]
MTTTFTEKLPSSFIDKMKQLLQDEYPDFLASYAEERAVGLRRNPLKLSESAFEERIPFALKSVPWAGEGYYLQEPDRPGKHPYYHAGLYYIQEPSAMSPVELLDVRPGERVLDLCGAPGGKSTQIAGKLQGQGYVVANDNHPDRVKAMVKNLELFGVTNAVVLNELPERLADRFGDHFDKILVDAPCSGEGMFRKEPEMAKDWSPDTVLKYAGMQREIIASAAKMLRPGGRLVYSTCTFSPEENEGTIAHFLAGHPDFRVVPMETRDGFAPGKPEWLHADGEWESLRGTVRLWPHRLRGEGHYVAVLERVDDGESESHTGISVMPSAVLSDERRSAKPDRLRKHDKPDKGGKPGKTGKPGKPGKAGHASQPAGGSFSSGSAVGLTSGVDAFWHEQMAETPLSVWGGTLKAKGEYVYFVPFGLPALDGLRVVRGGWFVGSMRNGRFEPSQALAMGLKAHQSVRAVRLSSQAEVQEDAIRYLKGETLHLPEAALWRATPDTPARGYTLVCLDDFPLGWGKWQDGMLKNEYPPGWRWT